MSCKALQLNSCEVAGSTFQGRKFTFPARDISGDTFTAKVRGYNVPAVELTGVKTGANVYFSFAELEGFKPGKYIIQYWAELAGIGREMIASEDFTVSSQPCSTCEDSADASFVLEFPNDVIEYAVTYNVVNIGGGGGSMTDAEVKAAYERNPNTNAFTDEEKQSISDLTDAQSGVLAARDAANQAAANANDAALNAINSAQAADNAAASVNTAIQGANTAATAANQSATAANGKISETEAARQSAITAANEANTATIAANQGASNANTKAGEAATATTAATNKIAETETARQNAVTATTNANAAANRFLDQVKVSTNTTLAATHAGKTIISTAAVSLLVNTGLADGFQIAIIADGGAITFTAGTSVTFKLNGGKTTLAAGKTATLIKENGTNNFYLKGELS